MNDEATLLHIIVVRDLHQNMYVWNAAVACCVHYQNLCKFEDMT